MEEKKYSIYCHTNKMNGKRYIGLTGYKDQKDRWRNGKGYQKNKYLTRSIEKYGWENFEHDILETNLTLEEAKEREKYYIKLYKTFIGFEDSNGYNLTLGGEGCSGMKLSTEARARIGMAHKGKIISEETRSRMRGHGNSRRGEKNCNYGRNPLLYWSEESVKSAKEKWSDEMHERWKNEDYRKKVTETMKVESKKRWKDEEYVNKHSGENHFLFGKHRSEEVRNKISKTRKERIDSGQIKKMDSPNKGKILDGIHVICGGVEYISIRQCAKAYDANETTLREYLNGVYKMSNKFIELGLRYANKDDIEGEKI